ncbi:MAG: arsenate reductase ArsC [Rhodospirillales bacterium]
MNVDIPGAVLFACTMNAIRSPMAEAIMKHLHGKRVFVDSVGVRATTEIDGFAVAVMDEIGIDLSRHHAKTFDDLAESSFDYVITLSPEAQHRAVEMTRTMACEVLFWNTFDPSVLPEDARREDKLDAYRMVRDQLTARIKQAFPLAPAP